MARKLTATSRELDGESDGLEPENPRFAITPKMVLGAIVALLVGIFIASNRERTTVNFVFDDVYLRLWTVLLLTFLIGGVTGYLLSSVRRSRRNSRDRWYRDDED